MKQLLYICAVTGLAMACISCKSNRSAAPLFQNERAALVEDAEYSSNGLIIMVDESVGKEPLRAAIQSYGAQIIYDYSIISGMAIQIPGNKDINDAIAYFKNVTGVLSVERDAIYHIDDGADLR